MAARFEGRSETPTITRRRHVLACARCRARRVKCDRAQPTCSNCVKAGALCQPAQQQLAPSSTSIPSRGGKRDPTDKLRLSKLEEEVARLSKEVDSKSPSREPSLPPSPVETGYAWTKENVGKIATATETRYFGPYSWATFPDELAEYQTALANNKTPTFASTPGSSATRSTVEDNGPLLSDQLHELLLNLFSHRVDPLIRILHWPSFLARAKCFRRRRAAQIPTDDARYPYFAEAAYDASQQYLESSYPEMLDSTFMALLYSVYYAALVSVIDSPSPPDLGPHINVFSLITTFKREVTNRVLPMNDAVARNQSLEVLQAAVLYLSVEPDSFDIEHLWLQLGATTRIAQGLGVHHDGAHFGLRPIEIETRRRVWAQICILDVRFAEQLGREPTISTQSYDTALPLSISDRDLSEIDEQDARVRQGKESKFKSYHEIEQSLERQSPFSTMTIPLVTTEAARLIAHFSIGRFQARDSIFHFQFGSPQLHRSRSLGSRSDRAHWISRLEYRFQGVYGHGELDSANPIQHLVSEIMDLVILKAKFVNKMLEWREGADKLGISRMNDERDEMFRDAIIFSVRCLTLIHNYTSSPFSWYTKRLRDVYTSSFLALCLASQQITDHELTNSAFSALTQLYPGDESGVFTEHGLAGSTLGRLLQKARMTRHLRIGQTIHSGFSTTMAEHATATMPTSGDAMTAFQPTGNLFEDFESIIQEPLWSAGLSGVDNPFGNWV
ncbi:hypothetical protein EJ04DRAFT_86987 [Polyplosphaeria fusca]|uniref:Zn(2)-C6 fungal-type domain-containing protein n=1 Tax=Polyplosphaeria fusca TaxID=682080 RepID=A0A9P4R6A0_9PLEO|nr:hypothetical protein EJ04DRAFT_86987 [Polyplosphaeria fusca]